MRLQHIFTILFATLVPSVLISFGLNSAILVLLSLIALYKINFSDFKGHFKKYILFNTFTLVILIGTFIDLIYGNPIDSNQLLKRLSFIVLPIIVFVSTRRARELALYFYIYFLSTMSTVLLTLGLYRGLINKGEIIYGNWNSELTESFYKQDMLINWGELSYKRFFLQIDMHPSYYALASIFAILILLFYSKLNIKPGLKYSLSILHILIVGLLSSKAGIISLLAIGTIYVFTIRSKKNRIIVLVGFLVLSLGLISIPTTQIRIKNSFRSIQNLQSGAEPDSTTERIVLWRSLKEHKIKELLIGLGNEGAKNDIREKTGIDKNMHNQFLQALLSSGILGLLLLVCFVSCPLYKSYQPLGFAMVLVVVINLSFENMLDRIWGITLISFFYSMFLFGKSNNQKDCEEKTSNFHTFNQT